MLSKLRELFKRRRPKKSVKVRIDDDPDLSWLRPPTDPLDAGAWDRFWAKHVEFGIGPPLFDMFCDDRQLVSVMNSSGMKTILCAGSGISQEPRALAEAGFEVVALDLSPQAIDFARSFEFPEHAFGSYCDPRSRRAGGNVEFVVGNFLDPDVCPGPFDVVIERRTAQIFLGDKLDAVLTALENRLSQRGILLSHSHDGAWKPPAPRRNFTELWFRRKGWHVCMGGGMSSPGRVAWLLTTTG